MKRKINFLGISGMLLLATIACQREDFAVSGEEKQEDFYEKVSLDEAKAFFEQAESRNLTQKGANFVEFVPNWNEFQQVKTELDLNYSKLPIRITHTQIYGEVLFLKKNDSIQQTLLMLKKDSVNAEGEIINGRFYLFNTKGIFIDAYKMENRTITKRLVVPWKKSREQSMTSRSCNAVFGTHVMMSRGVTSSWGVFSDCGRGGSGSNPEEQKISLDEVVVEYTPIPSFSYYWGAPSQGSSVRGNAVSASDVGAHLLVGGSGNRGKGGKSGNAPNIPTIPDEKEDKVEDRLTDKCAKKILNQMRSATGMKNFLNEAKLHGGRHNFSEMILDLFEKSSQTHLVFENGTIETGANGATKGTTIRLDNGYLRNATQLSIARTIIHEMVHAYLNANFYGYTGVSDTNFQEILKSYVNSKGINDMGRIHHEFMAQYVDAMAVSLQQWDMRYGSQMNLGFEYYRAMAFAGLAYRGKDSNQQDILIDTDSFKELVPNEADRNKIKEIIKNEQKGNKDAKGTKCK